MGFTHYQKQCKDRCRLTKNIKGKKEACPEDKDQKNNQTGRHNADNSS